MYLPHHFREERVAALSALVRAHPLGALITLDGARPEVDHIPMLLDEDPAGGALLVGHIARANPLAGRVQDGVQVLVLFGGAQHYITPSWYARKQVDGKVVPTWNYSVVHVRGRIRWFDTPDRLRAHVEALTSAHESRLPRPWSVADAPADYLATMLTAIIGFEIAVDSMIGKFKASQNRSAADREGVAHGLADAGVPAQLVAELVREPIQKPE